MFKLKNKINQQGIILLEVILSVVLVATTLGVILQSMVQSYRTQRVSQIYIDVAMRMDESFSRILLNEEVSLSQNDNLQYAAEDEILDRLDSFNIVRTTYSWPLNQPKRFLKFEYGLFLKPKEI